VDIAEVDDGTSDTRLPVLNESFETDNELPGDPPRCVQQLQEADVSGINKVGEDDAQRFQAGNNETEDVTQTPKQGGNVITAALRRASSTTRAEKTKNSSNKVNKDRTSIVGAIVKLIERQQPPSLNQERDDRSSYMAMTLMRQLDRMNKSMDDREHCDRKRRAKKRAKRRAKKKKRRALKDLPDHGGKAGGGVAAAVVMIAAAATIAAAMIKLNIS
jgi:hypothetical protein